MTKTITDTEFYETYKPVKNPLDQNASFGGSLLETYGAELDYVLKLAKEKPDHVWTVTDSDGALYIGSGYSLVNRIGYIITEVPFTEDVTAYDPEEVEQADNWTEDADTDDQSSGPRG